MSLDAALAALHQERHDLEARLAQVHAAIAALGDGQLADRNGALDLSGMSQPRRSSPTSKR